MFGDIGEKFTLASVIINPKIAINEESQETIQNNTDINCNLDDTFPVK